MSSSVSGLRRGVRRCLNGGRSHAERSPRTGEVGALAENPNGLIGQARLPTWTRYDGRVGGEIRVWGGGMERESRGGRDMPDEEPDERLLETIFEDARKAATMAEDDWWALSQFPLVPLAIPVSFGTGYPVTQAGVNAAHRLTGKVWDERGDHRQAIDRKAFDGLSFRAIGQALQAGFARIHEEADDADGNGELDRTFYRQLAADFRDILDKLAEEVRLDVDQHIPCTLFHGDQNVPAFSVGPVEFLPRAVWIERFVPDGDSRDLVNQVERRELTMDDVRREALKRDSGRAARDALTAVSFLGGFAWVGTSRIADHELRRSHRKASMIVGLAIEAVGLLFHVSEARRFARAGRAHLFGEHRLATAADDGRFIHGWSAHLPGFGSGPNEIAGTIRAERGFLDSAGGILGAYLADSQKGGARHLVEAWVNALYWFGEARREVSEFMAVVKYGCAIDVLSGAGGEFKEIRDFAEAALAPREAEDLHDGVRSVAQAVKVVYKKGRNKLAHGETPGVLEDFREQQWVGDFLLANLFYVVTLELAEVMADETSRVSEVDRKRAFRCLKERLRKRR